MKDLRRFFTILNFHIAGVVMLGALAVFLGIQALLAVHAAGALSSDAYQQQQITYGQLRSQMAHLQGLPQKVDQARGDAMRFYEQRIAPNYSTIDEELNNAAVKNQVRLSRAQYTPTPAIEGLTEVRIDASLSGDYTPMMHFINDIERDQNHVFFIIEGLTFTGQQGGLVNLRLRVMTYLWASATDLPPTPKDQDSAAADGHAQVVPAALHSSEQEAR